MRMIGPYNLTLEKFIAERQSIAIDELLRDYDRGNNIIQLESDLRTLERYGGVRREGNLIIFVRYI